MTVSAAEPLVTVSPIDEQVIAEYERHDEGALELALDRTAAAQREWSRAGFEARAAGLRALAGALRENSDRLAGLVTLEMGKATTEAKAEVEKCAWVCEYYADHGAEHLAAMEIETDWPRSFVQFPPLGVVFAVMPWNYPLWQVMRAAAPALMAGNTMLLKHASNVTGSALALGETVAAAGLDPNLLTVVVLESGRVSQVIADPRVAAVTLTGSEGAGIAVAQACAENLKKSVLELGGSDPFVVLADADIEAAAKAGARGRFLNAGQSCIAAKRFVVVEPVAAEFEEAFAAATSELAMGDPREESVDLGPMARVDLRDELAGQLAAGLADGGRVICGGEPVDRPGAWMQPTIVAGVGVDSVLAREETFGPVAAVLRAADDAEAIRIANTSRYGLSSSVWTRDVERAAALAAEVEAGAVFVNTFSASDPRMPFGGLKRSGWGRELGPFGIREFVNVQAVTVATEAG